MPHPFQNKIFVFIGIPMRCTRQAASDALVNVGGITDERITAFTEYAVVFNHNGKTKIYQKALEYDRKGLLILLDEERFFDILNGKSEPPEELKRDENIIVIPPKDPESYACESEKAEQRIKNRKRLNNMAKQGIPMPDGGREKIDLRPLETAMRVAEHMKENAKKEKKKFAVTMATLESHNHIVGDIERGVKIYNRGGVEFEEQREPNYYWARVPHKSNSTKMVTVAFSRDGQDIEKYSCDCSWRSGGNPVCRHIVAAVLSIQGGIIDTKITLGKTATVTTTVDETTIARAVGSGSLAVIATPMMIALMERAACEVLADDLGEGQISVGTFISVNHTAASLLGSHITATARITSVRGRKIEFDVTASDEKGEIGDGKHIRVIVDESKFIEKTKQR